jgi:cation:H+ antiporter
MLVDLSGLPFWAITLAFALAAAVIGVAGTLLAYLADEIATLTKLGQALIGGVLLGGATSLSGLITSLSTAGFGYPTLSISNAVGGIAAQTAFLAVADFAYRRANLEHAAASAANLTQGTLLIALLSVPLAAMASPDWTVLSVHPASVLMAAGYAYGLRLMSVARESPMWQPLHTDETRPEEGAGPPSARGAAALWLPFAGLALLIGAAGLALAETAVVLSQRTGLGETAIGGILTAVVTSLPELVTSVAAVRRGALNLAVGGILGGNAFDVLFLAGSDVAYREGSIYHAMNADTAFVVAVTVTMTAVLLLGLLRREKYGPAGVGFESMLILLLYAGSLAVMVA